MCRAKWQENGFELYKNVAAAAQMFPTLFQGTMKPSACIASAREAMQADGVAI